MFSSRIFARPSFLEGIARILDFGNTLNDYNLYFDADYDDHVAWYSDWLMVDEDIQNAMTEFSNEKVSEKF